MSASFPTTRSQRRLGKNKNQQLRNQIGNMAITDDDNSPSNVEPAEPTSNTFGDDVNTITPPTIIEDFELPLHYDEWDEVETAEAKRIVEKHKVSVGWMLPQRMPVKIHIAAPHTGRFTREVETDISLINSIEVVKTLAKNRFMFELARANIEVEKTAFAVLMIYGPTTEFRQESIAGHTRGLFLQDHAYKKWWMDADTSQRKVGDMVKIAVVLMNTEDAAAKKLTLPSFWPKGASRVLGEYLEKIQMPAWDLEIEKGCRSYIKLQQQVQDERIEKEHAKAEALRTEQERKDLKAKLRQQVVDARKDTNTIAKIRKIGDQLVDAMEKGDMAKFTRVAAAWKKATMADKADVDDNKSTKQGAAAKGGENVVDDDGEEEEADAEMAEAEEEADAEMAEAEEDEDVVEGDDSNDSDYVE